MNKHTVLFAHLDERFLKEGDKITSGKRIGTMGNTGASFGAHLHIACFKGVVERLYSLHEVENRAIEPAPRQLNYFMDDDLFKTKLLVTTYYNDYDYFNKFNKVHEAYDCVPLNRHETDKNHIIYWNRSKIGTVVKSEYDDAYGNYLLITF